MQAYIESITLIILRIAVPSPLPRLFDYRCPDDTQLSIGARVKISFGHRFLTGLVLEKTDRSDYPIAQLKTINKVLDEQSLLTPALIYLLRWSASYYHYPIGMAVQTLLPTLLKQGKVAKLETEQCWCISAVGKTASLAASAHKQRRILNLCQTSKSYEILKQQGIQRAELKKLEQRGWLIAETYYPIPKNKQLPDAPYRLNQEQQAVMDKVKIGKDKFQCYLLDGVTGSGKTEIYLQLIQRALDAGKQSLVLIPEINLTPQTHRRFQARFREPIAVLHSKLSNSQRLQAWLQARAGLAPIVLGTRSALWTPLNNLGLIIVDEEHDQAYKQQSGFYYSARDLAIVLAQYCQIPILLGSATPSLQSWYQVEQGRYQYLSLSLRAGGAQMPDYQLLDLRQQRLNEGFSKALLAAIRHCLAEQEQVLVYINRRGYAPTYMCHECGWISDCPHCHAHQTYHAEDKHLHCHHCNHQQVLPTNCPDCQSSQLRCLGYGSERISTALATLFPTARILRIDSDSTRKKSALPDMLQQIYKGEVDILVGTQMLAKGHHFPKVSLVAVMNIDSGLFSVDFRAAEKMAQSLIQVAGRSGRAAIKGKVLIQTHHPDHPLLNILIKQGYGAFAKMALLEREQTELPPYHFLALLQVQAKKPENLEQFLDQAYAEALPCCQALEVEILGPLNAPMALRAGYHRGQLLFQAAKRQNLQRALQASMERFYQLSKTGVRWQLDVDPHDLY